MIIITGDSWGCGEWGADDNKYTVLHNGLEYYIKNSGKKVINISQPGGDNTFTYHSLANILRSIKINPECFTEPLEMVLIFKTEWSRDFMPDEIKIGDEINHMCSWYYMLSDLAKEHNIKIGIIGGLSDTLNLENFEVEYPGLFIACQSLTNLLVNNDPISTSPVHTVSFDENLLQNIKFINNDQLLDYYLDIADKGLERQNIIFKQNKEWFFPDGGHPNRHGHKKLYDYLKAQNIL